MHKKLRRALESPLVILVVALLLRLGLLAFGRTYRINPAQGYWNFGGEMGRIGRSLAEGQGFSSPYWAPTGPTAQQPPVYPFVLAGAFKLLGVYTSRAAFALLSLNALLSALLCSLVLLVGRTAFGKTAGLLAAWMWVFWPSSALLGIVEIGHENLDALLLAVLFWVALRLENSPGGGLWLFFGFLWGLAALSNPVVLAVFPFLLGWLGCRRRKRGLPVAGQLTVTILLAGIVIFPWLVRNYEAFDRPVFLRDDFGLELSLGNHPGAKGAYTAGLNPGENSREWNDYRRLGEMAYMSSRGREAFSFIGSHPGEYVWLCLERVGELWIWTGSFRPFGKALPPLLWQAFYLVLPALALIGLVLASRERIGAAWPLALGLCVFLGSYVAIEYASPRFRYPVEPEMMLLGAYALSAASRLARAWIHPPS